MEMDNYSKNMSLFSTDYYCSKYLNNTVDRIYNLFFFKMKERRERFSEKKYRQSVQCLVSNVNNYLVKGYDGLKISLDKNTYSGNLIYDGREVDRKVSYTYIKDLLSVLDEEGWIDFLSVPRKPYYRYMRYLQRVEEYNEPRMSSVIVAKDPLLEVIETDTKLKTFNHVELRDKDKNPIKYKRSQEVKGYIQLMRDYNYQLSVSDVKREGKALSLQAKKIFSEGSWEKGGRCYVDGGVQNVNHIIRNQFLIDDSPVVELDYKAQHPRIIASLSGVLLEEGFDPYSIRKADHCGEEVGDSLFRLLCKKIMMCMLNTKSFNGCVQAVFNLLEKEKEFDVIGSYFQPTGVINDLSEHNSYLSEWLFNDSAYQLQNLDSKIADYVIESFLEIDEIVLPVHDSFIVKADNESLLEQCMHDAWEVVLGTKNNCIVEKK